MALINCPECGKEISEMANTCPNCGYPIKGVVENQNYEIKRKIPGRGFGISGMILGILGVVYSPMILLMYTQDNDMNTQIAKDTGIISAIYISIFGILALIFGLNSRKRGYKNGKSKASVILGILTIIFCFVAAVVNIITM